MVTDASPIMDILGDDVKCVEGFFKIPSKQGSDTVSMILKPAQRRMAEVLKRYKRVILLKSSQIGSTSGFTAFFYRRTMFTPNTTSVIISHKGELSKHLFDRTTFFNDHLPPSLRVPMGGDSKSEKSFPAIGSKIYIGTAGSADFGRGEPIHNLLCSEWLFYTEDQYKTVVVPALNRVPESGTAVLESTPHGENFGYELIMDCLSGKNRVWHMEVFYWFEEPDNQLRPDSKLLVDMLELQEEEFDLEPEEQALAEEHGLTFDQIRWRRYMVEQNGEMFWQEQVESLDTCFLTIAQSYYDKWATDKLRQYVGKPKLGPEGALIWEEPQEGVEYCVGGDPGQARQTESAAWVIRVEDGEPLGVALLAGMYAPEQFGKKTVGLAKHYNRALVVPEANGHGIAYIDAMKKDYAGRLWLRRDIVKGIPTMEIGWYTSTKTKPFMMEEMNRLMGVSVIPDSVTQSQIRAMGLDDRGRVVTTMLDDRHDAWGLALMGMRTLLKSKSGQARGSSGFTSWDRRK